ncbi:hypothetical protein ABZ614_41635 [Streptomyces sp. NPDC013178]|uniref:WXG100 family type VII secretion target n=1 Tax=Streptomyces sp. NPDC013178 TaxID=3155118 RepID=UPI0034066E4B
MSRGEFRVALAELRRATNLVRNENGHIRDLNGQVKTAFESARQSWQSPSGVTFETMSTWFATASDALTDLFGDAVRRMETAHRNYLNAERTNTHNVGG